MGHHKCLNGSKGRRHPQVIGLKQKQNPFLGISVHKMYIVIGAGWSDQRSASVLCSAQPKILRHGRSRFPLAGPVEILHNQYNTNPKKKKRNVYQQSGLKQKSDKFGCDLSKHFFFIIYIAPCLSSVTSNNCTLFFQRTIFTLAYVQHQLHLSIFFFARTLLRPICLCQRRWKTVFCFFILHHFALLSHLSPFFFYMFQTLWKLNSASFLFLYANVNEENEPTRVVTSYTYIYCSCHC